MRAPPCFAVKEVLEFSHQENNVSKITFFSPYVLVYAQRQIPYKLQHHHPDAICLIEENNTTRQSNSRI